MKRNHLKILLIEDNPGDTRLIREMLLESKKVSFDLECADRLAAGLEKLAEPPGPDAILLDLSLPDSRGLSTLDRIIAENTKGAIIVLTGLDDEDVAVNALQHGAQDYLVKGRVDFQILSRSLLYAIERKRSEDALKESEARYRDLLENANDLIQSVGPEGQFLYVNRAWRETLGFSEEEIKDLNLFNIIHPDHLIHCKTQFSEVMQDGSADRIETVFMARDGRKIIVEGSVNVKYVDGKPVSSRGIFRDITMRKKAEAEAARMQTQLVRAQKMEAVGTLAGGIAHDFNNLLTAIQGYTELTMAAMDAGEPAYENLTTVQVACRTAANIVRQLLVFSRNQPMDATPNDINELLADILKMLKRLIGEDIVIETDCEPGLWTVFADRSNLEQVIMNLAVNARDAMPEGGRLRIKNENVVLDHEFCMDKPDAMPGRYVRLTISDTGVGMSQETIDHLFEPFFTTKDVGKGTGLGLAVAYGIIKQHKGFILVDSTPGRGSTFMVFLPARQERREKTDRAWSSSLEALRGNGERILLVEDEQTLRDLTVKALEKHGYKVFAARNGQEAQSIFIEENGRFHLVFSDVVLPDTNGLKLIEQLRGISPGFQVLLSSGYTDKRCRSDIIKKMGYPYLQKPYSMVNLLARIKGYDEG